MNTIQIIDALGGPSEIGRALGCTSMAVSNWKSRGLPKVLETRVALLKLAQKKGVKIDASILLGIDVLIRNNDSIEITHGVLQ